MDIKEISKEINQNAHEKGFWDKGMNIPEKLMLTVGELSEAMEADREGKFCTYSTAALNGWVKDSDFIEAYKNNVKGTFDEEIADAVIRLFDLATELKIDLPAHIQAKVRYNKNRPHMHGGKKY
jgi:NTP pyrophosphatase (non-canonical NTP hydrolase)